MRLYFGYAPNYLLFPLPLFIHPRTFPLPSFLKPPLDCNPPQSEQMVEVWKGGQGLPGGGIALPYIPLSLVAAGGERERKEGRDVYLAISRGRGSGYPPPPASPLWERRSPVAAACSSRKLPRPPPEHPSSDASLPLFLCLLLARPRDASAVKTLPLFFFTQPAKPAKHNRWRCW